jgi:transposase
MRLLEHGQSVMEVAHSLGVAHSTVSGWKARLEADGAGAVKDKPRSGRPPKLSPPQREELVRCLEEGPLAHGYKSDLWTLPRVKRLIQERFGVSYHVNHLGELLRSLGFTPQRPARRSRQRDPEKVRQFREERWPEIKKKGRRKTP